MCQHLARHPGVPGTPLDAYQQMSIDRESFRLNYRMRGELCPKPLGNLTNCIFSGILFFAKCATMLGAVLTSRALAGSAPTLAGGPRTVDSSGLGPGPDSGPCPAWTWPGPGLGLGSAWAWAQGCDLPCARQVALFPERPHDIVFWRAQARIRRQHVWN